MDRIFETWRRLINEKAFGTFSMPSGKLSSPCPQGEEQNGFHPNGEPYCRPKPKVKEKKKLFKKAKIQPYNFDWGLIDEDEKMVIDSRKDIINYIRDNPNQPIHIDKPRGSTKKFGGKIEIELPFDYGEWPHLINPVDNMGWDLIIVSSATKDDKNLIPVGYVAYNEKKPSAMWNDKIIIAPNGSYTSEDRKLIENVFKQMDYFDNPIWY